MDRNNVEINCREKERSTADRYLPSKIVPKFFQNQIHGQLEEIERFKKFVDQVIGLSRNEYLAVISCLSNFSHALQILNFNIDLAYSMLVYSLESLSQNFDEFEPNWKDYYPEIKKELDDQLSQISPEQAEEIRKVLLKSRNFRLQQRFINFITSYVSDSFFLNEATEIKFAVRKSELKRALTNAYKMRSLYVHQLKPVQDQLRHPQIADGDIFQWENEPYLTFGGLARLAYHVINNFIWRQNTLDVEDYDWAKDLPSVVMMNLAPEYWIGKYENFIPSHATKKLSGFLTNIQAARVSGKPIVDFKKLLKNMNPTFLQLKRNIKFLCWLLIAFLTFLLERNKECQIIENSLSNMKIYLVSVVLR